MANPNLIPPESPFTLRRRLYSFIKQEDISKHVLDVLLPNGNPLLFERQMWDYKIELPIASTSKESPTEKQTYDAKMAEVMKDVVSFYNSYGGYLVIGVQDNPREIVGFDRNFNCDDLNKRIKGATRHDVGCTFALHDVQTSQAIRKRIGLLFVPQRPDHTSPAQFTKAAPSSLTGKKAYAQGDIYFRQSDECIPAKSSEDLTFLCAQGRRRFVESALVSISNPLSNNLRERDPGFIKFVGRDEYLQSLWHWLLDRYSPGKLLAGVGGIGKTTIAREFAEQLTKSSPFGFERIIWFSAKKRFYTAVLGKYVPTMRVDFADTATLLRALLLELGCPESMVDPEWTTDELIDEVIDSLKLIPSLVVVDDVDSLEPAMQQEVFHTMLQVMTRAISSEGVSSRVLLTARLDLGAAPAQVTRVTGLQLNEFADYVQMTADGMGLPWMLKTASPQMKEFHRVSSGSPSFGASILRLVALGEPLGSALTKWRGSEGNDVRAFAFEKELNNLSDSQIRTLYAMCVLGDSSQLELRQVTLSSDTLLMDDLAELRKYHLVSSGGETAKGGARLTVPNWIRLMRDLIKGKVRNPEPIEKACGRARQDSPDVEGEVGRYIYRVVALWRNDSWNDALEVAQEAKKKFPSHPDLRCLLGRAYLKASPPQPRHAEAAFRKAHELKCQRVELLQLWVEAKKMLKDWVGILDIVSTATEYVLSEENVLIRAEAYINLGDIAIKSGDYVAASKHLLSGIDEIEDALERNPVIGRTRELLSTRALLYQSYILMLDKTVNDPNNYFDIWHAVARAYRRSSISESALRLGVQRLRDWWTAVEGRRTATASSLDVLNNQIEVLGNFADRMLKAPGANRALIAYFHDTIVYLKKRASAYNPKISQNAVG
jgi:tetratricopeptide (TPR) repeat protein